MNSMVLTVSVSNVFLFLLFYHFNWLKKTISNCLAIWSLPPTMYRFFTVIILVFTFIFIHKKLLAIQWMNCSYASNGLCNDSTRFIEQINALNFLSKLKVNKIVMKYCIMHINFKNSNMWFHFLRLFMFIFI